MALVRRGSIGMPKHVLMNDKPVDLFQKALKTRDLVVGEDMPTVQAMGHEDEWV